MIKRYLLLDVDGVLIPFPNPSGYGPATHRRHQVVPLGYDPDQPVTIWLNPDHGPMIRSLLDTGLVTVTWATSWHGDANRLIGTRLGLPELPIVPLGRPAIATSHPHGYLWKRDPVTAWIGTAPVAWIDDDFAEADHAWADERTTAGIPTLLVQPDPKIGMLPGHLTDVHAWARALRTGPVRRQQRTSAAASATHVDPVVPLVEQTPLA